MTLKDLSLHISEQIQNNISLIDLKSDISAYKAKDWLDFVEFCDEKYTRNLVYIDDWIEVRIIC